MERDDPAEPDVLVELREGALVAVGVAQVIAGGEGMLGVEAEPQPFALLHGTENPPHLLERATQSAALPGRDLQRDLDLEARAFLVRLVNRVADRLDASLFAGADVRSRMRHEIRHSQRLASLELVDESGNRTLAKLLVRSAEVEQVRIVGYHGLYPRLL